MSAKTNYQANLVGVIGKPVDENPTGVMFEAAFKELGMNWHYLNIEVLRDDLEDAIKGIRAFNMSGMNITMPYKVDVVSYLDAVADDAALMGAVNAIRVEGRKLIGENTDGKGFLRGLRDDGKTDPDGRKVVLLGAGGAARAIAVELALAGAVCITVVNRSKKNGKQLSALISDKTSTEASFVQWKGVYEIPSDTDIVVNATPIGFTDPNEKPPINYDAITDKMVVCDVIPNNPSTLFLREGGGRGARLVDGLSMLVYQGVICFKIWTGVEAPVDIMRGALRAAFGLQ